MLKIEGAGTTERVENFVILIVPWGCSGCDLNIETHTFFRARGKRRSCQVPSDQHKSFANVSTAGSCW